MPLSCATDFASRATTIGAGIAGFGSVVVEWVGADGSARAGQVTVENVARAMSPTQRPEDRPMDLRTGEIPGALTIALDTFTSIHQ
jgi:hypothetical protein